MAFTGNFMCTSFKQELLEGAHDFRTTGDTIYMALYTNSQAGNDNMGGDGTDMDASVTNYSSLASNESSGTGYSAGGQELTKVNPTETGTTAFTDFDDEVFSTVSITARGALIYNTTADGGSGTTNAIIILDFGGDKTATAGDFTVQFPTADASNAIIRIA